MFYVVFFFGGGEGYIRQQKLGCLYARTVMRRFFTKCLFSLISKRIFIFVLLYVAFFNFLQYNAKAYDMKSDRQAVDPAHELKKSGYIFKKLKQMKRKWQYTYPCNVKQNRKTEYIT